MHKYPWSYLYKIVPWLSTREPMSYRFPQSKVNDAEREMTEEIEEEPDLVEDAVSKKELIIARDARDVQKMRLNKLMENPVSV